MRALLSLRLPSVQFKFPERRPFPCLSYPILNTNQLIPIMQPDTYHNSSIQRAFSTLAILPSRFKDFFCRLPPPHWAPVYLRTSWHLNSLIMTFLVLLFFISLVLERLVTLWYSWSNFFHHQFNPLHLFIDHPAGNPCSELISFNCQLLLLLDSPHTWSTSAFESDSRHKLCHIEEMGVRMDYYGNLFFTFFNIRSANSNCSIGYSSCNYTIIINWRGMLCA